MTKMDIQQIEMIEAAAERGALRALERLGLHDEDAGKDVHDLRSLIEGWRSTKKVIREAILKWATISILGLLAVGVWMQVGGKK